MFSLPDKMPFENISYCNIFPDRCWFVKFDIVFFAKVISMGAIVTVGLIGNFLLALSIIGSDRLRSKSVNVFIVNLSISNFLNLSFAAPAIVTDSVTEFFVLGKFICHAMRSAQVLFFVVPMLTLLAISVDRFLAIRSLLRDQRHSWKTFLVCLVIWCAGVSGAWVEYRYKTYSTIIFSDLEQIMCYENWYLDGGKDNDKDWEFQRLYW